MGFSKEKHIFKILPMKNRLIIGNLIFLGIFYKNSTFLFELSSQTIIILYGFLVAISKQNTKVKNWFEKEIIGFY